MADYRKKEAKLLIDTDFKELKLTNEKMRTAYINQQLSKEKYARANYEHNIDILNDLIRLRQKEVTP